MGFIKSFVEIRDSITDVSPGRNYMSRIGMVVSSMDEVEEVHKIRARRVGNNVFLDLHVLVNPDMSVKRAP
ncbi:MAG TPA: hypothetical protein ENF57_02355 [Candidatus Korarchaeota archaeon]|nr:hypothetical protein [Candidatus Korarchaeota archaeon]